MTESLDVACETGRAGKSPDCRILHLTSLSLHGFRNYASARIEVGPAPVVLTGHNGAGKTNILEAISLLTPGRGLRRAKLGELDSRITHTQPSPLKGEGLGASAPSPSRGEGWDGGGAWAISSHIYGMQGQTQIGTGRDAESADGDKRIIKIDGKICKGQAELARHLSMVWLTPQMEQLFQEGASAGRKFLDRLVYSFDAEQASRINEYEYAMRERNKLLQQPRSDGYWLDALEQTMAETGAAIAQARLSCVEHINQSIQNSTLSFPKGELGISGLVENLLAEGVPAVQAEEQFKAALKQGRREDAAAGRTLAGVHRSEMSVIHLEKQMLAQNCSTGEQKAMLLCVVLAQARSCALWRKEVPVILLDEVVAHLDARRRLELFEEICQIGAQTWMTGTDASLFAGLEGTGQYYQVENGELRHG